MWKKYHLDNWKSFFVQEENKEYFINLLNKVSLGYQNDILFPNHKDLFRCLEELSLSNIKVIIIGQDPYHNDNQANGLAFATNLGNPIPKSLNNIFKEINNEYSKVCTKIDLKHWTKQGVLLLNTIWTVYKNKPLSCKKWGWEKFTLNLLKYILNNNSHIVIICFGKYTQKFVSDLNYNNHYFLNCAHPSPLSANSGFFGSNVFIKTNKYLKDHNKQEIKW